MSNFLAIGGVSATLQSLLHDHMELPDGIVRATFPVTVGVPLAEDQQPGEPARVNLFLYRVTENGSLKNQMIPGQGHPSEYGTPPLSLILHYLLTAYGATDDGGFANETRAHFLLASAMRVLHDNAIIPENALDPSLQGQFERIKLCLDPISLDDLSKIWTAVTRPYRLSAAYTVSVVQIESRRVRTVAAPVETRRIHLTIIKRPQVSSVYRMPSGPGQIIEDIRVRLGQTLTIRGSSFRSDRTYVKLGELEPIGVEPFSDEEIRITVPDDTYPIDADHPATRPIPVQDRLRPGPQAVEVQTRRRTEVVEGGLDKGVVVLDDRRQYSNHSVFLLIPEVTSVNPASGNSAQLLTVNGRRLYQRGTKSVVLVGDVAIPVEEPRPTDPWAMPTDASVQVPLTALGLTTPPAVPGTYNVRMMVNGAQSTDAVTFQLT